MYQQKTHISATSASVSEENMVQSCLNRVLTISEIIQFENDYALVLITHFFKLTTTIHLILAYLLLSNQKIALEMQDLLDSFLATLVAYRIIHTIAYLFKFVNVAAMIVALLSSRKSLLWNISLRFLKYIVPISEADLILSSLLLIISFTDNILPFLVACFVNVLVCLLADNCTNRKMESYLTSHVGSLVYKLLQIIILLGNSITVVFGMLLYFYIFNFLLATAFIAWYSHFGISLYFHIRPRIITIAHISLYTGIIFLLAERILLEKDFFSFNNILEYCLVFPISFAFWFYMGQRRRHQVREMHIMEEIQIKAVDLEYHQLLTDSVYNKNVEAYILGIFQRHRQSGCSNLQCYTLHQVDYDPALRVKVETGRQIKQKESILRFHIKCIYQKYTADSQLSKALLDYVQFLLQDSFDLFQLSRLFTRIEVRYLGMFDTIRLRKLKTAAKEEATKVNQLQFQGKMEIQRILQAETTFVSICNDVSEYLRQNLNVWRSINAPDVNITLLRQTLKENLVLLDKINQKWMIIAHYLPLQRHWRAYYQNYCHLVLNEKKNQKKEAERSEEQSLNYFHIEPEAAPELLISNNYLFSKDTMLLHAYFFDRVCYLIRTNRAFEEMTNYSQEELKGIQLIEILPLDLKKVHDDSMLKWLEKGESNNYDQYPIRFTQLKTKDGRHIPVIKYFKMMANLHSQSEHFLEFVCMLKLNEHKQLQQDESGFISGQEVTPFHVSSNFLQKTGKQMLKSHNNIFVKEESLQPVKMMEQVMKIERGLRLLLVCLVLMTMGQFLVTTSNSNSLDQYSLQYINFLDLYRYPMAFGTNVLKTFLNVGNQTKTVNQIGFQVSQISRLLADQLTIKSIFDESLNRPQIYYPFLNDSFNQGIGYNQIDLIYFMVSCIQSVNKLPADRKGEYFTNFNMYIVPAYDNLANSTKIQFYKSFSTIFDTMLDQQYIVVGIQIFTFLAAVGYLAVRLVQYLRKSRECLRIIIQFGDDEVSRIEFYSRRLRIFFASFSSESGSEEIHMVRQLYQVQVTEQRMLESRKLHRQISLNKRHKNVYHCKEENRRWVAYTILLSILILAVLASILSLGIANVRTINKLHDFQEDGFYFLRYFPATSVIGYAILERYYNQQYPNEIEFYPQRYAESISHLSLIGNADYIGKLDIPDSLYFQYRKNYLFGNPCAFNPAVLAGAQTTMTNCLTIYNRTFSQGIAAFLRACKPQLQAFLYNKINLTDTQVDELTVTLSLVSYYMTDAINEWSSQFSALIADFSSSSQLLCGVISIFLLIIHLIGCEVLLMPRIKEDYDAVRRAFCHMVPQAILVNEKVVRQKFIINGILRQQ